MVDKDCPACARPFENWSDYPKIRVQKVEVYDAPIMYALPIDSMHNYDPGQFEALQEKVTKLAQSEDIQTYLKKIQNFEGKSVETKELEPPPIVEGLRIDLFDKPESMLSLEVYEPTGIPERTFLASLARFTYEGQLLKEM